MTDASDAHEELRRHAPPPADFGLLIESFAAQAMTALGKMPDPMTGRTGVNLLWARYFIDLLALLERKTAGNLEPHERSILLAHLSTLRLTYVDTAKSTPPAAGAADSAES
jgi:hypothetical protein